MRKWHQKSGLGRSETWEYEVGDSTAPRAPSELLSESLSNVISKCSKINCLWYVTWVFSLCSVVRILPQCSSGEYATYLTQLTTTLSQWMMILLELLSKQSTKSMCVFFKYLYRIRCLYCVHDYELSLYMAGIIIDKMTSKFHFKRIECYTLSWQNDRSFRCIFSIPCFLQYLKYGAA